ncbi:MAG: DUF4352 domain-containing protein [Candidatus Bilamarchaeaceae archaeon]
MKTLNVALFALLLLGVLLTSGCICGATEAAKKGVQATGETATSPSSETARSVNIEDGKIGELYAINDGVYKYTVTLSKVATATSQYSSDTKYLMAYFEIKNVGDKNGYFSPDVYALDPDGEKYDKTIPFGMSDEYGKTLDFIKELPPGTKMSGWVAIDVPPKTKNLDLYLDYSNMFLDKKPTYIKWKVSVD